MVVRKADIIAQLKKDVLVLQGFKPSTNGIAADAGLGPIRYSFPGASFPTGAMHEFICSGAESMAATSGFIAGIIASFMQGGRVSIWIGPSQTLYPPALRSFGIDPDKMIFIYLQKEKDILWAMEEALKCESVAVVVGEIRELSFTVSRRFQLAVEQSRATGFILRNKQSNLNITACVTRWKITALPTLPADDLPGVGFPRWNVELVKVRNGQPGNWQVEWNAGRFHHISTITSIPRQLQKKTG